MRSQGLPSSFLPAHLGINYDPPPPAVLHVSFMPAGVSQPSHHPVRQPANPRSSCSKREVERLSPWGSNISIYLVSFTRVTDISEFTAQTCYVSHVAWECSSSVLASGVRQVERRFL